jgi:peptide/nickel transport system permease protein
MQGYIFRRLFFLVFVIIGISVVLFTVNYLLPGDPAEVAAGWQAKPEQVEAVRRRMGLDKPAHIQYLTYMRNLLRGDLGTSILSRRPVLSDIKAYLPASLELGIAAMLLNLLIGFPLGVFSALRPGRLVDTIGRFFSTLGMGMPLFWVGLLGQLVLSHKLDLLPFGGRLTAGTLPPDTITGFYTVDALLVRDLSLFKDALVHLLMPAAVLALPEAAVTSRLMRSSMLDVLLQDYVRTARAKGLRERRVVWVHALKNALLVPLTMVGMQIGWMLSGSLLVESVFSWAGLGFFAYHGIYMRDFPVIMGFTFIMTGIFVFSNLVVDILYHYLDPRITY